MAVYTNARSKQEPLPPYAEEAEQGILGCVLLDLGNCLPVLRRNGIGPRHFYDARHAGLLEVLIQMAREGLPADSIIIVKRLEAAQINGIDMPYLEALKDCTPSAANLEFYLPDVQEAFQRRQILALAVKASQIARDPQQNLTILRDTVEQFSAYARNSSEDDLPEIVDSGRLVSSPPPKPAELVCGLLHRGSKLVLGGGSKSYKTWALTDLGLSVSHGEPWLGFKTTKGRCLYLNLELQPWAFSERISSVAKAKNIEVADGLFEVWNLRGYAAPYHVLIPKIKERVAQADYALILVDPIYKVLGDADENAAGDIGRLLNALEELSVTSGAAVAFGAHFSKGNQSQKQAEDRISGSGVFARDPDSIMVMTRHEEEGAFTVDSILRNFKPVEPFVIRWDFPLFRRDTALNPAKLKQLTASKKYTVEQILKVLNGVRLSTENWCKTARAEIGMSRRTFYDLLQEAKASKTLKQSRNGQWFIENECNECK